MSTALNIGVSALAAHQTAMEVTSHNIANAATPGFSRQRADLSTLEPQSVKPGQLGRGVKVDDITRTHNDLITRRIFSSTSEQNRLEFLSTAIKDAELVFNEPSDAGFSATLDAAFSVLDDLANNPELAAMRAGSIQNLRTFTATMNSVSQSIFDQRNDMNQAIAGEINEVNGIITEIVSLNSRIQAETAGQRSPNDLLDRRDTLITELSQYMDLQTRLNPVTNVMQISVDGALLVSSHRVCS